MSAVLTPARGCDCGVCPFYVDNPKAVEPICSGCNTDCSYCGCARGAGAVGLASCGQCPIRCGSRVDIAAWMADVGGTLTFDDIDTAGLLPASLPRFVPQVDGHDIPSLDRDLHWAAYGIGLRRVYSPTSHRIYPRLAGRTAHEAFSLRPDQLAVLVGYGEDPLVEGFWTRRRQLIPALAAQSWDLVLAPNYSMYGNQPRAEHLLNFRRNLLVAAELNDAGVPAIPNIYWFRREDLDRTLGWVDDLRPSALAVNLQTFRTPAAWDMALAGLTYFARHLPSTTRVILTGVSRAARIGEVAALFGTRLHLVAQNALQYARHGALMTSEGRRDHHARVEDLFAANVRYYASLLGDSGVDR